DVACPSVIDCPYAEAAGPVSATPLSIAAVGTTCFLCQAASLKRRAVAYCFSPANRRLATTSSAWYMKPPVLTTRFTELVGCSVPLQQAGMGTSDPELAVAVARAGGLGMVSGVLLPPARLAETLDAISIPTGGAIGVNFLIRSWRT